jgi:rhodanese-related sulfurtransferase
VKQYFPKPFSQSWQELRGDDIFALLTSEQAPAHTIQKVRTFTPPSSNRALVGAQLAKNLENACIKLRKYQLAAERMFIFLRSQDFQDQGREMDLWRPTSFPNDLLREVSFYEKETIPGTTHIPFARLEEAMKDIPKDRTLVCICGSGRQNSQAAKLAAEQGYKTAAFCPLQSWKEQGYPTEPGKTQ